MPAMIETTSVDGPANGLNVAPASRNDLRLHRDHQRIDLAGVLRCGIEPDALRGQRADLGGGMRLDHHDAFGVEAAGQPSRQHRAAHLAGAGERNGAVEVLKGVGGTHRRHHKYLSSSLRSAGTHNHRRF